MPNNTSRSPLRGLSREYLLILLALLVLITIAVEPRFLSGENVSNIMRQFGPLIMVALGMTYIIIGGYIDLSVAGIMSLVSVVTLSLIDPIGQVPALAAGLGIGVLCGFINSALLISSGGLTQAEALFFTYGMSVVYSAIALIYTGGMTKHMSYIVADYSLFKAVGAGSVGPLSVSFLVFLAFFALLYLIQSRTYVGRCMRVTGGNIACARLCGIPVERSVVFVYVVSGFMSALGSLVLFSRVTTASPVMGKGYEMNAILAVVVGGTALTGGRGGVLRTVFGTILVILLSNCMNLLGVSVYMQFIMKGAILVAAIWLDHLKQHRGSEA
jgi:ribose transport system permease protein